MQVDEKIVGRLKELIQFGERVLATKEHPPPTWIGDSFMDTGLADQWATQCESLLSRVFGESSAHYTRFKAAAGDDGIRYSPAVRMQGVMKAALDDYSGGYLFDVRRLVAAQVFDQMLQQSRHLLETGYFQPAIVLAGAVLEDTLRSTCARHGIAVGEKPKLDRMNADLAKAGAFSTLTQKRITAIADVRNSAAHGKWDAFTADDVSDALQWIERFVEATYA